MLEAHETFRVYLSANGSAQGRVIEEDTWRIKVPLRVSIVHRNLSFQLVKARYKCERKRYGLTRFRVRTQALRG